MSHKSPHLIWIRFKYLRVMKLNPTLLSKYFTKHGPFNFVEILAYHIQKLVITFFASNSRFASASVWKTIQVVQANNLKDVNLTGYSLFILKLYFIS